MLSFMPGLRDTPGMSNPERANNVAKRFADRRSSFTVLAGRSRSLTGPGTSFSPNAASLVARVFEGGQPAFNLSLARSHARPAGWPARFRLAGILGVPPSRQVLIQLVMAVPDSAAPAPAGARMDDFAIHRRRRNPVARTARSSAVCSTPVAPRQPPRFADS